MALFEETVKIRYSEMDCDLVLKPGAMLQFLQDLASDNAESLGFGYSYIIKHNLAWFLLKYRLEFDDYPEGIYDLTIKTEPRGYNKMFAYRDFYISHQGKQIGRATSTWTLVDLTTKSMANASEVLNGNKHMVQHEKRENDLNYGKIRLPENFDIQKTFEVRFDDLDVNRHVNNANYIVWAIEPLDFEFRRSHKLKTVDMMFKKEIRYGSSVLTEIAVNGNETIHAVKNAETREDLFLMNAEWVRK
jgi:medium-chain acyl-[acyl-carrier-protein] hydrolase